MTDLQTTLDAIDELAVHECGHCRRPLQVNGPSPDYCDDECQADWLADRHEVQELVGYREPYDLPQHESNLVELYSPEVTPPFEWVADLSYRFNAVSSFRITVDTSQLTGALERAEEGFRRLSERMAEAGEACARVLTGMTEGWVIFDEIRDWQPTGILNEPPVSLAPEPELDTPPFGSDFDFEHRTATTLPDQPPAAVMPDLPDRDWQAIVDARVSHTGPVRVTRVPRHLGRTR